MIDDQVWDVTSFAPEHPGGANRTSKDLMLVVFAQAINICPVLLKFAGQDATKGYSEYHSPSVAKDNLALDCFKGNLDRSTIDEAWKRQSVPSKNSQAAMDDDEKPPLHNIINLCDRPLPI